MARRNKLVKENRPKKYFNPEVTKIKLEPEQAVLSCCSSGQSAPSSAGSSGYCCASPQVIWCLAHSSSTES